MSRYLSPKALAEECGVHVATVRQWIREYEIPHTRIGRKILIKETDFDHWMRRMRRRTQQSVESIDPVVAQLSQELDAFLVGTA